VIPLRPDPPLVPSPDEARGDLRRELTDPAYQQDLLSRLLDAVERWFAARLTDAAEAPLVTVAASVVVFLGLALALFALLSRARRSVELRAATGPVLEDERVSAAELRGRAERALAEGRHEDAVVDGVRALTVRQVERGALDDVPAATAREVTRRIGAHHEALRPRLDDVARVFDAVRYGDAPASASDAGSVLALDDELAGRR